MRVSNISSNSNLNKNINKGMLFIFFDYKVNPNLTVFKIALKIIG